MKDNLKETLKDLIRWHDVSEYEKTNNDWVLVKIKDKDSDYYYDLPHIAEKRIGGWFEQSGQRLDDIFEIVAWKHIDPLYESNEIYEWCKEDEK